MWTTLYLVTPVSRPTYSLNMAPPVVKLLSLKCILPSVNGLPPPLPPPPHSALCCSLWEMLEGGAGRVTLLPAHQGGASGQDVFLLVCSLSFSLFLHRPPQPSSLFLVWCIIQHLSHTFLWGHYCSKNYLQMWVKSCVSVFQCIFRDSIRICRCLHTYILWTEGSQRTTQCQTSGSAVKHR